jgi:hypothetical protein
MLRIPIQAPWPPGGHHDGAMSRQPRSWAIQHCSQATPRVHRWSPDPDAVVPAQEPAPSPRRRVHGLQADERAGQVHEPQQDIGAPLIAHLQPPVAHQPCQRPLHHIPVVAQPLAGLDAAAGDPGRDPAAAQRLAAAWVVVPLVEMELGGRLRGRPGRPRGPLTAGTASTTASSSIESWVLAAESATARGMPLRSTSRWYLVPGLPRSVGFGPVSSPPAWRGR